MKERKKERIKGKGKRKSLVRFLTLLVASLPRRRGYSAAHHCACVVLSPFVCPGAASCLILFRQVFLSLSLSKMTTLNTTRRNRLQAQRQKPFQCRKFHCTVFSLSLSLSPVFFLLKNTIFLSHFTEHISLPSSFLSLYSEFAILYFL